MVHYGSVPEISFLRELGAMLSLPQSPIAAAATIFHRFYKVERKETFDPWTAVGACLFLACKSEEKLVSAKDILVGSHRIRKKAILDPGQELLSKKDELLGMEQVILRTLQFDIDVELPYAYLLNYLKLMRCSNAVAETAWGVVNDSFFSDICLHCFPHELAVSAMHMASVLTNEPIVGRTSLWYEPLDVKKQDVERILGAITTLYEEMVVTESKQ